MEFCASFSCNNILCAFRFVSYTFFPRIRTIFGNLFICCLLSAFECNQKFLFSIKKFVWIVPFNISMSHEVACLGFQKSWDIRLRVKHSFFGTQVDLRFRTINKSKINLLACSIVDDIMVLRHKIHKITTKCIYDITCYNDDHIVNKKILLKNVQHAQNNFHYILLQNIFFLIGFLSFIH